MKKKALIIIGLNKNTSIKYKNNNEENRWYISSSNEIIKKIQEKIDQEKDIDKIIFYNSDSSLFNFEKNYSKMNIEVFSNSILSPENEISINDYDNNKLVFNGDQIDFLLPPDTYELYFSGIDLVGSLSDAVVDLSKIGYYITVFPSLVKSYKDITYPKIKKFCKIDYQKNSR